MVNGEIFYARYPITIDTKDDFQVIGGPIGIFPTTDFDIIFSETIPISGGSGKTNAVMLTVARAKT